MLSELESILSEDRTVITYYNFKSSEEHKVRMEQIFEAHPVLKILRGAWESHL